MTTGRDTPDGLPPLTDRQREARRKVCMYRRMQAGHNTVQLTPAEREAVDLLEALESRERELIEARNAFEEYHAGVKRGLAVIEAKVDKLEGTAISETRSIPDQEHLKTWRQTLAYSIGRGARLTGDECEQLLDLLPIPEDRK